MINPVETFGDVGIQDIFGFVTDKIENSLNSIVGTPSWSEPITIWFKVGFPFWFKSQFNQGLFRSVFYGRNREGRFSSLFPGFGIQTRQVAWALAERFKVWTSWSLCSGVSDLTPSIPAVFLPWFSWVTRLTTRQRADQDLGSNRWSLWTVGISPSCTAR